MAIRAKEKKQIWTLIQSLLLKLATLVFAILVVLDSTGESSHSLKLKLTTARSFYAIMSVDKLAE
jgi:hypothetical protein